MIKKHIGYGGDLFIPSKKYMGLTGGVSSPELKTLIGIGDLFLIHDKVSFRADQSTTRELFSAFTLPEIEEFIKNGRISFYLPRYSPFYTETLSDDIEKSLDTGNSIFLREPLNASKAVSLIFDNLELPIDNQEDYTQLTSEMNDLFYKHGIQRDSFFTTDRCFAFDQAIQKIRELWVCGIFSTSFDDEVLHYLSLCDKAATLREMNLPFSDLDLHKSPVIDDLHSLKNLPSLAKILLSSEKPVNKFMGIINSAEADELRKWIQKSKGGNVDVRDLYDSTVRQLPSKKEWVDWTRFGSVTAISGILGTILTANPLIGMAIGGATSALDKVYGDKVIDSSTKVYNPDAWFSFIQNAVKKG
ncbi:hypothetical protein BB427_20335 [Pseudoalteromonas sp. BMB]|uniref:hypothetical protein n=1 Tax=Pseudoalteromonas sp. BMB TaxID=1874619 RepID=UPI00083CECBA|nr:hypothetical protein [Pseudoalteromonas sp. BMB]ODB33956.1 hypothetical protein BB427_20335 [Pseudoalteromonas sp. BMB]